MNLLVSDLPPALALAHTGGFDLERIDWRAGVGASDAFMPEDLTPLYYTDAYALLGPGDRLVYNQITALALCEQFIVLEDHLLAPVIERLIGRRRVPISSEMRTYLERFLAEERKHSEMFWRTLETAAPDLYRRRRLAWAEPTLANRALVALFVRAPETVLAWVWMALLFEERTIDISRRYRAAPAVAPLFRKIHHLHMVEEAQHVELDKILLERLFAAASPQVRAMNARLFKIIMARLAAPQRIPLAAIAEAARRNPSLAPHLPKLRAAVAGLGANRRYQEAFFSRRALPVTCRWLDRFPEMHVLAQAMPAYDPPSRLRTQEAPA